MKHVLRACATVLASAAFAVTTLGAAPAFADEPVPSGCIGSHYFVCAGSAQQPPYDADVVTSMYIALDTPRVVLLPGQTVGGQQVGGIVVPVGDVVVPGVTTTVGGDTEPIDTGLSMPISVCAFVTCVVAGTPIALPGLPLPVVPVVIPGVTVPGMDVEVPVLGTVPSATTPTLLVPAASVPLTTIRVWVDDRDEIGYLGYVDSLCVLGGGSPNTASSGGDPRWRHSCSSGSTATVANAMYAAGGYA